MKCNHPWLLGSAVILALLSSCSRAQSGNEMRLKTPITSVQKTIETQFDPVTVDSNNSDVDHLSGMNHGYGQSGTARGPAVQADVTEKADSSNASLGASSSGMGR